MQTAKFKGKNLGLWRYISGLLGTNYVFVERRLLCVLWYNCLFKELGKTLI